MLNLTNGLGFQTTPINSKSPVKALHAEMIQALDMFRGQSSD
jgi:hypothetical protein